VRWAVALIQQCSRMGLLGREFVTAGAGGAQWVCQASTVLQPPAPLSLAVRAQGRARGRGGRDASGVKRNGGPPYRSGKPWLASQAVTSR
jgi:hypothetical protein